MKHLFILLCFVASFSVAADTSNQQENIAAVSPTTVMNSSQINNNHDTYNRVGSVQCASPTITGNLLGGEMPYSMMAQVGFTIPLGGSVCKGAMKGEAALIDYRAHIEKVELARRGEMLEQKLKTERDRLEFERGRHEQSMFKMNSDKVVMCDMLHKTMVADPETELGAYMIDACAGVAHMEQPHTPGYPVNHSEMNRISAH